MKNIISAVLSLAALSSCSFIKVDTSALAALLSENGADVEISATGGSRKSVSAKGPEVREYRGEGLPEFDSVESSIPVDIEYSDGDTYLEITAARNIIPYIKTTVKGGTLRFSFNGAKVRHPGDIKAVVRTRGLKNITLNGAGDLNLEGPVVTDRLCVEVNGAGDIDIEDLSAESLRITVNGAGDVDIEKLSCTDFRVGVSGAGDIEADNIECKEVNVVLSGAGDCTLAGRADKADLSVNGVGSIDISALNVADVTSGSNGLGKIIR